MTWTRCGSYYTKKIANAARIAVEKALANHTDYDIEYRVRRSDKSEVWVSAKGHGIYAEDGSVVGMLGFVQDISTRKANEETLREQAEALRTLNEMGQKISAELDLHNTVQAVTDAATELPAHASARSSTTF